MAKSKAEVLADFKQYESENGGTNDIPEGRHNTVIMKGETHPVARNNANTGKPELFFVAQIQGGDYDRRTIPITLRWFTNEEDRDGNPKPKTGKGSIENGNNFLRSNTLGVLKGLYGSKFEDMPEDMLLPESTDSEEEVLEIFKSWVQYLPGAAVGVTVKNQKNSDFQNFSYFRAEADGFGFGD